MNALVTPDKADWITTTLEAQGGCVVDGIPQSLFAAQIPFGRLDADVPEQELHLF
jgi:hypothetical protein